MTRSPLLFAALIVAVAAALRIWLIDECIWYDEVWATSLRAGEPFQVLRTLYREVHPPVFTLFMHLWISAFGDSEPVIRIPAVAFGIGSLLVTWRFGRRIVGESAARLAVLLLAVSPTHIWFTHEARPYALLIFLTTLAAWLSLVYRERPRRSTLALFTAAALGAVLTHYYAVAIIGAIGLIALTERRRVRWRLAAACGVAVAAVAGYVLAKQTFGTLRTEMFYLSRFGGRQAWEYVFDWMWMGSELPLPEHGGGRGIVPARLAIELPLAALLAFGAATILRAPRAGSGGPRPAELLVLVAALPALFVVMLFVAPGKYYIHRSGLAALPFFFLLVGHAALAFRSARARRVATAAVVLLALAMLGFYLARREPLPDWRAVARHLEARAGAERRALFTVRCNPLELAYCSDLISDVFDVEADERELGRLRNTIERRLGQGVVAGWANALVMRHCRAHERWKADNLRRARYVMYRFRRAELAAHAREVGGPGATFFVVVTRGPREAALAPALADPTFAVRAREAIGPFLVYEMQVVGARGR